MNNKRGFTFDGWKYSKKQWALGINIIVYKVDDVRYVITLNFNLIFWALLIEFRI